ncbi:MAG: type IV secretion system protein VirD4, partial [Lachnospiraceae bacterium]|nr:type IV secretion system protein VirD4 [Lachnospiraceae bacterium]
YNTSDTRGTSQSYGLNYQKTGKDMPYLFVKSWLPNTKISRTGTRSADDSANHVCCAFPL